MPSYTGKLIALLIVSVALSGCGIKTRAYIADRKRLDVEVTEATGNAGYFVGGPKEGENVISKPTRKVFMIEFVKSGEDAEEMIESDITSQDIVHTNHNYNTGTTKKKKQTTQQIDAHRDLNIPFIEDDDYYIGDKKDAEVVKSTEGAVDYVISKDDTLQKISKKFYDSYSKWPRIYEANRDAIDDPNFLKPGTAIKIPLGEK